MKQSKATKVIVIAVVSVLVLGLVGLRLVDVIAKSVIDSEVTEILGVDAHFGGVDLGVLSSSSTFTGITIRNPPGFDKEYLLTIDKAEIDCGLGTLMSNDIDIPRVVLTGLTFDLEEVDKEINIETVIKNIQKYVADQPKTDAPTELEIRTLDVKNLQLTAHGNIVTIAGGSLETKIPDFTVKNIGTKSDTHRMTSQFINILTHAVLSHAFKHPIDGLSGVTMSSLRKITTDLPLMPIKQLKEGLENVKDALKDSLGGSGDDEESSKPEDD